MKKYILTIFTILALGFSSCEDAVTELDPISVLTEANFYQTAGDIDRAVLGIYNRYQSRYSRDWALLEMPTESVHMSAYRHIGGLEAIGTLDFQPTNDIIRNFWQTSYNGIFRANSVLTHFNRPDDYAAGKKEQFEGEAKFMRALFYFDLVRAFGDVPLVTTLLSVDAAKSTPRTAAASVYGQIISDLEDAIDLLPAPGAIATGRATQGAAVALLGKVYIYMEDWQNALTYLDKVSEYSYVLEEDFASLWTLENEDNAEGIFVLKYLQDVNGHLLSSDFIPYFGVEGIASSGLEVVHLSWSLHKLFDDADTRKAATIEEYWKSPGSSDTPQWKPYVKKFAVPHTGSRSSGLDLPVLRLADIILLKAEALYQLQRPEDALVEINRIRERAFGDTGHNYSLADIDTPEEFTDKILLERQLELAMENQRWFDLVRTERFMTELAEVEWAYNPVTATAQVVTLNPQPHHRYFPIPQHEIDQANPGVLGQNDGYIQ